LKAALAFGNLMSGLVIHIEAGNVRHTEVSDEKTIRIGTCADCALRLPPEIASSNAPLVVEISRNGSSQYRVSHFDSTFQFTHNGAPLRIGDAIRDGDEVRAKNSSGADVLTVQFFALPENAALDGGALVAARDNAQVAPFVEAAAIEARATERRDDAKVFLREFTRELMREINPSTKIITLLIVLAFVGGILYLGFALNRELRNSRRTIEAQNQQLAVLQQQLNESKQQFENVSQTNTQIINSMSLAPKIRAEYGNGVCLIAGTYIFVEKDTGKPLRYSDAPSEQGTLTPTSHGAIAEYDFVGTGFHVGDGFIVTNRHVAAQPWLADERAQSLSGAFNGVPRVTRLQAYFPGRPQPFRLILKQTSPRDDIAVCQIDGSAEGLPVLPLDNNSDSAAVGKSVYMMGYPTGPNRILVGLSESESREIQQRYGSSLESLLNYLAGRNLIRPLMTQGYITDLDEHRLVYGASTAEGGSGSPVFGNSGRVIGVNYAIYGELKDANFAVPIRFAVALLQRAGWKPRETIAEAAPNAVNGKEARPLNSSNPSMK
jgi:S1-C subfamily serine protease